MNSFLVTGGDLESRQQYLQNLSSTPTELIHLVAEKTTITIKQVKDLSLPLGIVARLPRLVWIEEANQLTIPAQNALLKMLEEPPQNTSFYLTCNTSSSLLPTIRSRCTLLSLTDTFIEDDPQVLADLKSAMALSPGDRLTNIIKRDRSESLAWITSIELALRHKLADRSLTPKSAQTLAQIAKLAQNTHLELSSNCSVSLATQHFYLTLPHTHSTK